MSQHVPGMPRGQTPTSSALDDACDTAVSPRRAAFTAGRERIRDHSHVSTAMTARPPALSEVAWTAGITAVKSAIVALAVDAAVNSSQPRFSGKAMKVRALGYIGGLLVVPAAWRLRGMKEPYPRELDLAVALPLLADAGGNAIGIYQRAHVDDAIHFANGALLSGVLGAIAGPRTRTAWEAGAFAAAVGMASAAGWEIFEWTASKLGAKGMDLSYDDTMEDLIETSAGALLGGLITLLRHPAHLRRVPGRKDDPIVTRRA
jgi:hypothetical protein